MKTRLLLIALLFVGCATNPYKQTNKSYKKQAKAYAKLLAQYPLRDSVSNSPRFVGTTNFTMRRPNFVVIHHTAQNTCDQTIASRERTGWDLLFFPVLHRHDQ